MYKLSLGARLCDCAELLEAKELSNESTIRAAELTSAEARSDICVKFSKVFPLAWLV